MQIIKYCMLFILFISSCTIGKYISQKYKFRLNELEEIKSALNIFKSKIKFTYEPLPEIFSEIAKNSNKNVSNLFIKAKENMEHNTSSLAWEKAIEEYRGNLNIEDKQALKTLSKLLRNNRCRWTA